MVSTRFMKRRSRARSATDPRRIGFVRQKSAAEEKRGLAARKSEPQNHAQNFESWNRHWARINSDSTAL